jgi:hypothetical protein
MLSEILGNRAKQAAHRNRLKNSDNQVGPALYLSASCGTGIVWLNRSVFGFNMRDVSRSYD